MVSTFRALARRPDPAGTRLLLDGVHLVEDAHRAGARLEVVAVSVAHLDADTDAGRFARQLRGAGVDVLAATDAVIAAMSPVTTPSGIVAIAVREPVHTTHICRHPHAFVVAAADVQDPGNLGSVLRVAEAAGATGAIVCGTSANPFAWKALRGSMGSALRLPVAAGLATAAAVGAMQHAGLRVVASVARGGHEPDSIDWHGRVGLLLGGEGPGLPADVVAGCDARTTIPMSPDVESLNVAVAAGVLCYAARRQRAAR